MTELRHRYDKKIKDLAERQWDMPAIRGRVQRMLDEGIKPKTLRKNELTASRDDIINRVQTRAEEYNFLFHNCPKGTAMALLEEFGLGNMDIIKALTPFPGVAGSGRTCGGVTGGLIAIGLCFGNNRLDGGQEDIQAMMPARQYICAFEERLGYLNCAEIQEHVVFGRNMDPGASPENMAAFSEAKGFEKCGLVPGIGAGLAAGIIIDHLG